ncbi:hypothetical protein TNCV_2040641 [Trichonephila clavipes]|nr:hypothetical protein TNCV_2040641 [Trichonephila clavipes]
MIQDCSMTERLGEVANSIQAIERSTCYTRLGIVLLQQRAEEFMHKCPKNTKETTSIVQWSYVKLSVMSRKDIRRPRMYHTEP